MTMDHVILGSHQKRQVTVTGCVAFLALFLSVCSLSLELSRLRGGECRCGATESDMEEMNSIPEYGQTAGEAGEVVLQTRYRRSEGTTSVLNMDDTRRSSRRHRAGKKRGSSQSAKNRRKTNSKALHLTFALADLTWQAAMKMGHNESLEVSHGLLNNEGYLPNSKRYEFWQLDRSALASNFANVSQGEVTVTRRGMYLIYIQVVYIGDSHTWAYALYVDNDKYAQCSASFPFQQGEPRMAIIHPCHLVVSVYLRPGQILSVRSLYEHRRIISLPHHTFWGIVRL